MKQTIRHHRQRYSKPFEVGFLLVSLGVVVILVMTAVKMLVAY